MLWQQAGFAPEEPTGEEPTQEAAEVAENEALSHEPEHQAATMQPDIQPAPEPLEIPAAIEDPDPAAAAPAAEEHVPARAAMVNPRFSKVLWEALSF